MTSAKLKQTNTIIACMACACVCKHLLMYTIKHLMNEINFFLLHNFATSITRNLNLIEHFK